MGPAKPLRRRLILVWLRVLVGWGFSLIAAAVLVPERVAPAGGLAAAVAVGLGVWSTRRALREERRTLITVRDLRATLRQRR